MMTHKKISKFKFDVSSELHQFAYDFEQSSEKEVYVTIFFMSWTVSIQIFDENTNVISDFEFSIDEDCNNTQNYLEFSKKFKAFKQQAEKLL